MTPLLRCDEPTTPPLDEPTANDTDLDHALFDLPDEDDNR